MDNSVRVWDVRSSHGGTPADGSSSELVGLYTGNTSNTPLVESTQADGRSYEEIRQDCLRRKVLFQDPDFPAVDSSLFYSESIPVNFMWKRPGEICEDPKFILGGADRTDICQGQLGDCWLLAAIASLTLQKDILARVVPPDQDFEHGYAGIFHFQFWQHNKWLDVVVDDRLPTVRNKLVFLHSLDNNEFWSALLEKAYAKLNGSYEALKGGSTLEAMEDFTGGVAEVYETKTAPSNLFQILRKALDRGSMMGCSIDVSPILEAKMNIKTHPYFSSQTPTGLVKGHAYSITGLEEVNYRGQTVRLIRVRNPWGQVEWNGKWSDDSREWTLIDKAEKARLMQNSLDDGEFWMEFEDFKANYDRVEICNLSPDALTDDTSKAWETNLFEGSWIRGTTAGGCRNFIDTFWTNPQFKLALEDVDGDNKSSVIIALMQKNRRKLRKEGLDLETIGFAVYDAPKGEDHLSKDFFRYNPSKARSRTYINTREVSERFELAPGKYLLVPTTFQPNKEADFLVRIFSEAKAGSVYPPKPSPPSQETDEEKFLRKLFLQVSGSMTITVSLFCTCPVSPFVQSVLFTGKEIQFEGLSLSTCHSIINLMDSDNSGLLEFQEFKIFWDKLKKWMMLFLSHDTDRSGRMSTFELRLALRAAGMNLNNKVLQLIGLRFGDDNFEIDFDDYLTCIVRLENMFREWTFFPVLLIHMNMARFVSPVS
uniref:Calpain 9 n=1 Tax=Denticeps clupeoides TaxID=299321 RepID=A0AAY4AAV8_9TELE